MTTTTSNSDNKTTTPKLAEDSSTKDQRQQQERRLSSSVDAVSVPSMFPSWSSSSSSHMFPDRCYTAFSPYYGSSYHMSNCLTEPIVSSAIFGILFTGMDVLQGTSSKFTIKSVGNYAGFLYVYHVMRCPMEAIHGKSSLWHNVLSGGILGYVGVHTRRIGIPFVNPMIFYQYPNLSPPIVGSVVYGTIAGIFAGVLGGKSF